MSPSAARIPTTRKPFAIKLAPLKDKNLSAAVSEPASKSSSSSNTKPTGYITNSERTSLEKYSTKIPFLTSSSKGEDMKESPSQRYAMGMLRHGERSEELFGIPQSTPWDDPYYQQCRNLLNLEENPSKKNYDERCQLWWQVLQGARQHTNLDGSSLLRLHRRATARLPWDKESSSPYLLNIWLAYARVQMEYSPALTEAQFTLRHLGATHHAAYHVAVAELDEKMGKTKSDIIKSLQLAISQGAQPVDMLHEAIQGIRVESSNNQQQAVLAKRTCSQVFEQESKRLKLATQESDKKLKQESTLVAENNKSLDDSNMSLDDDEDEVDGESTIKWKTAAHSSKVQSTIENDRPMSNHLDPIPSQQGSELTLKADGACDFKPVAVHHGNATPLDTMERRKPFSESSKAFSLQASEIKETPLRPGLSLSKLPNSHNLLSRQRRPLAEKFPRLPRLSGKAQRADPNQSLLLEEDEDGFDDATNQASNAAMSNNTEASKKSKPVLSKMDLSYIFEWDPNKRYSASKDQDERAPPPMDVSDDSDPSQTLKKTDEKCKDKNSVVEKKDDSCKKYVSPSAISRKTSSVESSVAMNVSAAAHQPSSQTKEQSDRSFAGFNPDFLPLANDNNIIRVNDIPYAKLGLIGKGASCRVYRALSKELSVFAIKRVKLEKLSKQMIESYCNEINLLKSLKGNPAIIQMYDSQINVKRKVIYVVMEVGEADLHHVLRQQSLLVDSDTAGRRRLNMNFVRLTWFQMLSAVQCIHEARIIHGDLKPANFLFVRGALKLIDFGIAKAMQNDDTTNVYRENFNGTLNYMSPEAFMENGDSDKGKHKLGRASDIWSLGCILYQMVYGRTPFAHLEQMFQKIKAIVDDNYPIRYPVDFEVEEAAIDAIKSCLRRKPEERLPIVGAGGLLNEHVFLNPRKHKTGK